MTALIGGVRASSSSACFGTQFSAAGEETGTGATAPSVPTTVCWPDARKMAPPTGRAARACFAAAKVAGLGVGVGDGAVVVVDWDATTGVGLILQRGRLDGFRGRAKGAGGDGREKRSARAGG
jgi:hypothetical protein